MLIHGAWVVGTVVFGILFFETGVGEREILLISQMFIISTLVELSQGIRDYEVDKQGEENTTVVYIGLPTTKVVYASLVILFSLLTPLFVENVYLKYLSLVMAPAYFLAKQQSYEQRAVIVNLSYMLTILIFLY